MIYYQSIETSSGPLDSKNPKIEKNPQIRWPVPLGPILDAHATITGLEL